MCHMMAGAPNPAEESMFVRHQPTLIPSGDVVGRGREQEEHFIINAWDFGPYDTKESALLEIHTVHNMAPHVRRMMHHDNTIKAPTGQVSWEVKLQWRDTLIVIAR